MQKLLLQVKDLQNSQVSATIKKRLKEFSSFKNKNAEQWFYELCFCLLTANWKAKESIEIQKELSSDGFLNWNEKKLAIFLKKSGHRFWPQRAQRIVLVRKFQNIKSVILSQKNPRDWLIQNIKGYGMKEASHFLRNVGFFDYAILDRHIINSLIDNKIIEDYKTLTPKRYLEIEKVMSKIAKKLNMSQGELDLYLWYLRTGKILK